MKTSSQNIQKKTNKYDWLINFKYYNRRHLLNVLNYFKKDNPLIKYDYAYESNLYKKFENVQVESIDLESIDLEFLYLQYVDRGINDWHKLSKVVKAKYPKVRVVALQQNYGQYNFDESDFDVIIIEEEQQFSKTPLRSKNLVFSQELNSENIRTYYNYVFEINNKTIIMFKCEELKLDFACDD